MWRLRHRSCQAPTRSGTSLAFCYGTLIHPEHALCAKTQPCRSPYITRGARALTSKLRGCFFFQAHEECLCAVICFVFVTSSIVDPALSKTTPKNKRKVCPRGVLRLRVMTRGYWMVFYLAFLQVTLTPSCKSKEKGETKANLSPSRFFAPPFRVCYLD